MRKVFVSIVYIIAVFNFGCSGRSPNIPQISIGRVIVDSSFRSGLYVDLEGTRTYLLKYGKAGWLSGLSDMRPVVLQTQSDLVRSSQEGIDSDIHLRVADCFAIYYDRWINSKGSKHSNPSNYEQLIDRVRSEVEVYDETSLNKLVESAKK